ncbi:MAG: NAD-dependent epimerase/dehydratase family protein [bacterium]|nr:NAD-dependent epimerase/dehydratase family protein [bacterium]
MSTETYVVTGGAGFIGSHIADGLLARGHRVVILDDLSTGTTDNLPEAAEFHRCDIRSPEAADLVRDVAPRAIFHQAAQMDVRRSTREPRFDAEVNILGTLNLLEAAVAAGVEQFLFASTGGAIYGEQETFPAGEDHPCRPVSPYGVAKLASERYLYYFHIEKGLNVACMRYANVYGERQNPHGEAGVIAIFLERLLADEKCTIHGDGLQTRDYVHVSNVVEANLAALGGSGFRTYNVGTGVETSVVELFRLLAETLRLRIEARHGPGLPGEQRRSSISAEKIRSELGWAEPLELRDGLKRTAGWFSERTTSRPVG